jgi:hypothetical protein
MPLACGDAFLLLVGGSFVCPVADQRPSILVAGRSAFARTQRLALKPFCRFPVSDRCEPAALGIRINGLATHCSAYRPIFAARCEGVRRGSRATWRAGGQSPSYAVTQRPHGRATRPGPPLPSAVHRLRVSMAQLSVAWLMSEDHRADHEDGRADPNDKGGFPARCTLFGVTVAPIRLCRIVSNDTG